MKQEHEDIMVKLAEQFQPLLINSPEGIYLWLDDEHILCNEQLADLFGYTDAGEIAQAGPFLETFVAKKDQAQFAGNYAKCIAKMEFPLIFQFQAVKKDGSQFKAETAMVPLPFSNHLLAYHFVRRVDE